MYNELYKSVQSSTWKGYTRTMKHDSKLASIRAALEALESLSSVSAQPAILKGAVFIDMVTLKWIKVAHVAPPGGYVYLSVGPSVGCDRSMGHEAVKESLIDRVGPDLLYFPPGPAAKDAVARIDRLAAAVG